MQPDSIKNRLAPVKKITIDRLELCVAVLNTRLTTFMVKECRYKFDKHYYIVDSQIVCAMIQKETYGFNTFAATRIGEIQEGTNPSDWYWIEENSTSQTGLREGRNRKKLTQIVLGRMARNFSRNQIRNGLSRKHSMETSYQRE